MSGNINFNGWLNDDGSENYKCRAWVNFNGTGTVAIRASGNVSSITDDGVGRYDVNFTTEMPDTNYCTTGLAGKGAGAPSSSNSGYPLINEFSATGTTAYKVIECINLDGTRVDVDHICVAIFR
jgi:hypothetical protein